MKEKCYIHVEPSNTEIAYNNLSRVLEKQKDNLPEKQVYLQIVKKTGKRFDLSHMETESDEKLIGSQLLVVHTAETIDQTLWQLFEKHKAFVEAGNFYYRLVVMESFTNA